MAKAALEYRTIYKMVTEKEEFVTLELTKEEAWTLSRLTYCHLTGPDDGPRGIICGIGDAIIRATGRHPDHQSFKTDGNKSLYIEN